MKQSIGFLRGGSFSHSHIYICTYHIYISSNTYAHTFIQQLKTVVFSLVIQFNLYFSALGQLSVIDQKLGKPNNKSFRFIFHPPIPKYFFRIIWKALPVGAHLFGLISSCIPVRNPLYPMMAAESSSKRKSDSCLFLFITNLVLLLLLYSIFGGSLFSSYQSYHRINCT